MRASQLAQASERVGSLIPASQQGFENFADVLTRCSGLLQGEDMLAQVLILFIA